MRPLAWIGYGLLFVGVNAKFGRWDAFVDPVGWVIVLIGLRRLTRAIRVPATMALTYFGILALVCSVPLWWPDTADRIHDGDASTLWAIGLSELLFQAVLCHGLANLAREASALAPAIWFRICEVGLLVGIVTPVLYFAAGQEWLKGVGDWGMVLQPVVFILCFWYSGRTWAGFEPRVVAEPPTTPEQSSATPE